MSVEMPGPYSKHRRIAAAVARVFVVRESVSVVSVSVVRGNSSQHQVLLEHHEQTQPFRRVGMHGLDRLSRCRLQLREREPRDDAPARRVQFHHVRVRVVHLQFHTHRQFHTHTHTHIHGRQNAAD